MGIFERVWRMWRAPVLLARAQGALGVELGRRLEAERSYTLAVREAVKFRQAAVRNDVRACLAEDHVVLRRWIGEQRERCVIVLESGGLEGEWGVEEAQVRRVVWDELVVFLDGVRGKTPLDPPASGGDGGEKHAQTVLDLRGPFWPESTGGDGQVWGPSGVRGKTPLDPPASGGEESRTEVVAPLEGISQSRGSFRDDRVVDDMEVMARKIREHLGVGENVVPFRRDV